MGEPTSTMSSRQVRREQVSGDSGKGGGSEPELDRPESMLLDLDRYVPALLNFIDNKMTSSATATYRTLFDVSVLEWRCLSLIAIEPWLSPQRLCQVIGLDKAAASRAVAKLRQKGLVQARANALRSRFLELALTEEGWRRHQSIIVVALERERRLLSALSSDERESLLRALHKMHGRIPTARESLDFARSPAGGDSGSGKAGPA